MTTLPQAREAIYQHWADGWTLPPPYAFDNEPYDPPAGPWLRLSVRHLGRAQTSLGEAANRRFESRALLILDYFEPPAGGAGMADVYLDAAAALFEGRRIAGTTIRFNAVITRERGVIEDGRWFAANAQGEFIYENIK